jgi:hypothetical protein
MDGGRDEANAPASDVTRRVLPPLRFLYLHCYKSPPFRAADDVGAARRCVTRIHAYGPARGLPDTKVGTFTQGLYDEATKDGWIVISMKNDWRRIFAFE